jgi:hypothetical protein
MVVNPDLTCLDAPQIFMFLLAMAALFIAVYAFPADDINAIVPEMEFTETFTETPTAKGPHNCFVATFEAASQEAHALTGPDAGEAEAALVTMKVSKAMDCMAICKSAPTGTKAVFDALMQMGGEGGTGPTWVYTRYMNGREGPPAWPDLGAI